MAGADANLSPRIEENRGPQLQAVVAAFLSAAWIFVGLRVYVKVRLTRIWSVDDNLLILAIGLYTLYSTAVLLTISFGGGHRLASIAPDSISTAVCLWWISELIYITLTAVLRCSIIFFLLRISIRPVHRYIIYAILGGVLLFSCFFFGLIVFQCWPVSYLWMRFSSTGAQGKCVPRSFVPDATIAQSVVSFVADTVLGLMPIALLRNLKMTFKDKFAVAALLSLGLFAGFAAMTRIPFVRTLNISDDCLFATVDIAIWSTIEPGLGIIAAGAATLRPLFKGTSPAPEPIAAKWVQSPSTSTSATATASEGTASEPAGKGGIQVTQVVRVSDEVTAWPLPGPEPVTSDAKKSGLSLWPKG